MNVVHEDVKKLVDKELTAATEKFGLHHSWHEKYAVTLEEVQECEDEAGRMRSFLEIAFDQIKENKPDKAEQFIQNVEDHAIRCAIYAIQVAAMCRKEIGTDKPKATKAADEQHPFTQTCSVCGSKADKDDRFCYECGAKLDDMENKEVRLIDANALLQECEKAYKFEDRRGQLAHCLSAIKTAPTIDAQPVKRGKWEWEPGYVGTTAKCSVCGLSPMGFYSLPTIQIGRLPEYPFCPKCGAKMCGGDADGDQV